MDGIISVLKPPGMTSHDVVAVLRRLLGVRAVGHTGTLDPGAAGALPVCVGKATRVAEFIAATGKAYRAEVTFGFTTDTLDGFGRVTSRQAVRATYEEALALIPALTGRVEQVPPMVSAVKYGGKKLYELARQGQEVERRPREALIEAIRPVAYNWKQEFPSILFDVFCSKGTYIRTLCADWGDKLGSGACMTYLLRTRSGSFSLDTAWTLEELTQAVQQGDWSFLLPADRGLEHLSALTVKEHRIRALLNGLSLAAPDYSGALPQAPGNWVRLYGPEGDFLALGLSDEQGQIRPKKVFGFETGAEERS